jgi:integrase
MNEFVSKEQEYARDIWLFLYRCNGINMADLLRMKWTSIKGDYFVFKRMKTETTRRYNKKDIVVPITPKVQELIDKVGVKESPFILGYFKEDFSDYTFRNKINRVTIPINKKLGEISEKLKLSVELKLKTARDSYATTLKRAGKSKDEISEMLGHSNSVVTEHYLASLDMEKTFDINECLF